MIRTVRLPAPLPHQLPILLDPHRFKVCCMGRQWGKTMMGSIMVLDGHGPRLTGSDDDLVAEAGPRIFQGALHGKTIWWVAPTFAISLKIWRDLKKCLSKWGGELEKMEVEKRIEFPGGGSVTIKSAHDPDSLRGDTLDGLVIDEAAFCHADTWNMTLRPTLLRRKGWAVLISTPNGLNWFADEYNQPSKDPEYASWRKPSSDNPTLGAEEIEKMRRKIGLYAFQRECLALFEVREGGMFKREWFRFFKDAGDKLIPLEGPCRCELVARVTCKDCGGTGTFHPSEPVDKRLLYCFVTADLAWSTRTYADFTAVGVYGRSQDGRLFLLDARKGRFDAPEIVPMLQRTVESWGARSLWLEASGPLVRLNAEAQAAMPGIVCEYAVHAGTDPKDKVTRAGPAAAAVESGRMMVLNDAPWANDFMTECCAFPDKAVHDDQVDQLSLAVAASPAQARPAIAPPRRVPPIQEGGSYWTGARRDRPWR